jgi:hypothetical protein
MEVVYDPPKVYDKGTKLIKFYIKPEVHARFLIFLRYHDFLVQTVFFETIIDLCLTDDEEMFDLIQKIKERSISLRRRRMSDTDFKRMKKNIKDFNLTQEDLDDIFSLIEQERGDM